MQGRAVVMRYQINVVCLAKELRPYALEEAIFVFLRSMVMPLKSYALNY
ncbi:MAG: hypothetical protein V3581_00310 [Candidatus Cardinium sp.]|nr:hypothetical protein [Candidatus Cardinium sp.]